MARSDHLPIYKASYDLCLYFEQGFDQVDRRFEYLEKHFDIRFDEQEKRFRMFVGEQIADLDRRMMVRMLVGVGAVSALVKLL